MLSCTAWKHGIRPVSALVQNIRNYAASSTRTTSNLQKPSYPVASIVADPRAYAESVKLRRVKLHNNQSIDDVVKLYTLRKKLQTIRQHAATEQNRIGKEIKARLSKAGKRDVVPTDDLRQQSAQAKAQRAQADKDLSSVEEELDLLLDTVPNLVDPRSASVPSGSDFIEVCRFGDQQESIPTEGKERDLSRDHMEIGLERGLFDVESGSRVSGTGNIYLTGMGARLEQALISYALDKCASFGFKQVSPPTLVRPEFLAACGFRPRGDDEDTHIYETSEPMLSLCGTAEIPLVCQNSQRQLDECTPGNPVKHCAVTRCFRREAGSRGADTRGLYRLHEFSKVEMLVWTAPSDSNAVLDEMVEYQRAIFEEVLGDVGTQMRSICVAPHDLGAPAFMKFDIEAWMPGRGTWGEISSTSNCLDFQSRRLHTTDANGFVHTLNGTAMAVPRVILAIIENGWNPEKRMIAVPKVLQRYLNTEWI